MPNDINWKHDIQRASFYCDHLFHYTEFDGMRAILESDQIMCTNMAQLNDEVERIFYADGRIDTLVEIAISRGIAERPVLEALFKDGPLRGRGKKNFYSASFSMPPERSPWDGSRSQFRLYGNYALVFNTATFQEKLELENTELNYAELRLSRIGYRDSPELWDEEAISDGEEVFFTYLNEFLNNGSESAAKGTYNQTYLLCCTNKHPSLHEEREIRLLAIPRTVLQSGKPDVVKEINGKSRVFVFKNFSETKIRKLPVSAIIVGPSKDADIRVAKVQELLNELNINAKILKSGIPLRFD